MEGTPGKWTSRTGNREYHAYTDWTESKYRNWRAGNNHWAENPGWDQNPAPPAKGRGSLAKGGSQNPAGRTISEDHGCKVYKDSDWGVKTNERSLARNMPVLSEFTRYGEWGTSSKRWANMLYNRPISRWADYFINNLKGGKSAIVGKNAGGA